MTVTDVMTGTNTSRGTPAMAAETRPERVDGKLVTRHSSLKPSNPKGTRSQQDPQEVWIGVLSPT